MSTRIGTANAYATAIANLSARQSDLVSLQDNLTSQKRITRASDDPTAAARAERDRTRMARIASDQTALDSQKATMTTAESTLGDVTSALQSFRELVVNAGSGTLTDSDRASLAQQMASLRDEIFSYANKQDSNGVPLFGGLGSIGTPFSNTGTVQFQGLGGQRTGSDTSVSPTIDGQAAFLNVPTGNGVFTVATGAANTGTASADAGVVTSPTAVTGHPYTIAFAVDATTGATTYTVTDTTLATTTAPAAYTPGSAIAFDGISINVSGTPKDTDTLAIAPSTRSDLFASMDQAIASVKSATSTAGTLPTQIAQSLSQLDAGLARISSARGYAGDVLNQVDRISDAQTGLSNQLEADRSSAEDLDMIKAVSDFTNKQTVYSAALSSYAQIQKLSLFNFIS
ncbi:MAG: flagellar hook-associated protein FlgL [Pseudomonadota bacterium]